MGETLATNKRTGLNMAQGMSSIPADAICHYPSPMYFTCILLSNLVVRRNVLHGVSDSLSVGSIETTDDHRPTKECSNSANRMTSTVIWTSHPAIRRSLRLSLLFFLSCNYLPYNDIAIKHDN